MARVLVADDEAGLRTFIRDTLEIAGHEVAEAGDGLAAIAAVRKQSYDVLLTDLRMPGADGLAVLRAVRECQPDLQVILMTAFGSVETAIAAMKDGAFDYLQKPLSGPTELRLLVERAAERKRAQSQRALAEMERSSAATPMTWGASAMSPVVRAIERVATLSTTVLLLGESGTGKEVAARAIHNASPRRDAPFVVINCAAISESLIESELFGHEKGSFTGATDRRRGKLEMADGGTFFMDEIGELRATSQAKLLRVLEEQTFQRVGGSQSIRIDVRWVAATNRDLPRMMSEGTFREDLYHRLAVFPVQLPPLRERPEDIVPLARLLLKRVGAEIGRAGLTLADDAAAMLQGAPWPGNVRELRNTLERASIMAEGSVITGADLAFVVGPRAASAASTAVSAVSAVSAASAGSAIVGDEVLPLRDLERIAIERALKATGGNRKDAAERLGIGLRTLYEKLKLYGIN